MCLTFLKSLFKYAFLLSLKLHLDYQTMDANSKFSKKHPNGSNPLTAANFPPHTPFLVASCHTHKSSGVGETLNCFQYNWSILQIRKLTQRVQLSIVTQLLSFWRLLLIIPVSHHNLYYSDLTITIVKDYPHKKAELCRNVTKEHNLTDTSWV